MGRTVSSQMVPRPRKNGTVSSQNGAVSSQKWHRIVTNLFSALESTPPNDRKMNLNTTFRDFAVAIISPLPFNKQFMARVLKLALKIGNLSVPQQKAVFKLRTHFYGPERLNLHLKVLMGFYPRKQSDFGEPIFCLIPSSPKMPLE